MVNVLSWYPGGLQPGMKVLLLVAEATALLLMKLMSLSTVGRFGDLNQRRHAILRRPKLWIEASLQGLL